MLSFLTFSTFQSLSLFPQDWPLRTTKLCSIYTSGLQHTLEIFFLFRTVGRYVYTCISTACHVTSISSPLSSGREVWGEHYGRLRRPHLPAAPLGAHGAPSPWSCWLLPGPASCARFWRGFCLREAGWSPGNWQQKWFHRSSPQGHKVQEL